MTTTEMEDAIKNIDARTTRIEQILPTLATKADLKAFATKDDLKAFATKDDLKLVANEAKEHAAALAKDARLQALILYENLRDTLKTIKENTARSDAPPDRDA